MRPRLFLPPWFSWASSRDFSGFLAVISSKEATTAFRVPGVLGFKFFNGMSSSLQALDQVNSVALLKRYDRFFRVWLLFDTGTVALHFTA